MKLSIVKIGGNVINNPKKLDTFLYDFAKMKSSKILVHGGGNQATEWSKRLGIMPKMIEGRRVTTNDELEVVTMIYAGLINKNITARLQTHQCNAIGLSGADVNSILSDKRPVDPIDFGMVGDVKVINTITIDALIRLNITPVFCALTHDGMGNLLNTNADTIASELAIGMSELYRTELIYCFEKKGVLADINNEDSVIDTIDNIKYDDLKRKNIIDKGMVPKLENGFYALKNKVSGVIIGNTNVIRGNDELHTTLTL